MSAQLWLFPEPKPLREKLGDAFFKSVPACAGVYVMTDARERVMYVGQSSNLHRRLLSYKNVRPDRDERRLARLVQAVCAITWEVCSDAECARLRENELLRLHRPKFNRINVRPEAYGFIGLSSSEAQLELWLTQQMTDEGRLYGAFKGARIHGYAALLRLLVAVLRRPVSQEAWPIGLLNTRPPRRFQVSWKSAEIFDRPWGNLLCAYLEGVSSELVDHFRDALPPLERLEPFWRNLHTQDLEAAEHFFAFGPKRNRLLKERHGLEGRLLAPHDLDDLLVLTRVGTGSAG